MPKNNKQKQNSDPKEPETLFGRLFSRSSGDQAYISDLQAQWADLDRPDRVKFVFGALLGLALFVGALLLAYWVLSSLVGIS